jgi:hypothetical protein
VGCQAWGVLGREEGGGRVVADQSHGQIGQEGA